MEVEAKERREGRQDKIWGIVKIATYAWSALRLLKTMLHSVHEV